MLRLRWSHACFWLAALASVLGLDCAPSEPRYPDATEADQAPAPEPSLLGDLNQYAPVGQPFLSGGHLLGRYDAQILANEAAAARLPDWVSTSRMPVGAALVQVHSREGGRVAGPVYGMVKREAGFFPEGNDWEWVVVDAEGRQQARGRLASCARCHAEALADGVFPVPRETRR